jgi:hypothetical protein
VPGPVSGWIANIKRRDRHACAGHSLFVVQPNSAPDAEIRQLKLTIAALRQALEDGGTARDELSRTIRAEYESEISHLKSTIAAVRAQLEQTKLETQEAVARAIGDVTNDIAQLRQTIICLRDDIETTRYDHEIRGLGATANEKTVQLQSTITALRGELEESTAQIVIQKQAVMAIAASEINELRATCQALRDDLIKRDESRGEAPNVNPR